MPATHTDNTLRYKLKMYNVYIIYNSISNSKLNKGLYVRDSKSTKLFEKFKYTIVYYIQLFLSKANKSKQICNFVDAVLERLGSLIPNFCCCQNGAYTIRSNQPIDYKDFLPA